MKDRIGSNLRRLVVSGITTDQKRKKEA